NRAPEHLPSTWRAVAERLRTAADVDLARIVEAGQRTAADIQSVDLVSLVGPARKEEPVLARIRDGRRRAIEHVLARRAEIVVCRVRWANRLKVRRGNHVPPGVELDRRRLRTRPLLHVGAAAVEVVERVEECAADGGHGCTERHASREAMLD